MTVMATTDAELRSHTVAGNGHKLARARGDERLLTAVFPCEIGQVPEAGAGARATVVFQRFEAGTIVALRTVTLAPNLAPGDRPIILSWMVTGSTVVDLATGPSGSGTGTFTEALTCRPSTEWEHFTPGTGPSPAEYDPYNR